MYIRGGKQRGERPYLTLMLHATAVHPRPNPNPNPNPDPDPEPDPNPNPNQVHPRLTFDRPEVILPAVPLGHTARASSYPYPLTPNTLTP